MRARGQGSGPQDCGHTLIEIVVAVLVVAFLAVPVMALLLSSRMSMGRASRRIAASAAMRRLSESLKAYIVADQSLAPGPGAGSNGWSLPGDRSGRYALAAGIHELDPKIWAAELSSHSAILRYRVTSADTAAGPQPSVSFILTWQEP